MNFPQRDSSASGNFSVNASIDSVAWCRSIPVGMYAKLDRSSNIRNCRTIRRTADAGLLTGTAPTAGFGLQSVLLCFEVDRWPQFAARAARLLLSPRFLSVCAAVDAPAAGPFGCNSSGVPRNVLNAVWNTALVVGAATNAALRSKPSCQPVRADTRMTRKSCASSKKALHSHPCAAAWNGRPPRCC
jgi:hypothetical protein